MTFEREVAVLGRSRRPWDRRSESRYTNGLITELDSWYQRDESRGPFCIHLQNVKGRSSGRLIEYPLASGGRLASKY